MFFHDYHHKFCQIQAVNFALLHYTSEVMILKIEQEDKYFEYKLLISFMFLEQKIFTCSE